MILRSPPKSTERAQRFLLRYVKAEYADTPPAARMADFEVEIEVADHIKALRRARSLISIGATFGDEVHIQLQVFPTARALSKGDAPVWKDTDAFEIQGGVEHVFDWQSKKAPLAFTNHDILQLTAPTCRNRGFPF